MKFIATTLLVFVAIVAFAQPVRWTKAIDHYSSWGCTDVANWVEPLADGSYVTCGYLTNSQNDLWMAKLNAQGNIIWEQTVTSILRDFANSIKPTADGGYIVGGTFGDWNYDMALVKLNANGGITWNYHYGNISYGEFCSSVLEVAGGGYLMIGSYGQSRAGSNYADGMLIRTDANGSVVWSHRYDYGRSEWFNKAVATADGGFVVVGYTESLGHGIGNHPDAWLVKVDGNGVVQWSQTYGDENEYVDETGYGITATSDGGYAIGGDKESDGLLIKTDGNGTLQWQQVYPGSGFGSWDNNEEFRTVRQLADGGYILGGMSTTSEPSWTSYDYWMVRADVNGAMLWNRAFGSVDRDDRCYCVQPTNDGGFILAGESNSFGENAPTYDNAYLIKTDENGRISDNYANITLTSGLTTILDDGQFDVGNCVNGSTLDVTFTLRNSGTIASALSNFTFVYGYNDRYSFVGATPNSVAGNDGSVDFTIRFTPNDVMQFTTFLYFKTEDEDATQRTYVVQLWGTGVAPWTNGAPANANNPNGAGSANPFDPVFPNDPNTNNQPPLEINFPAQTGVNTNPASITASYTTDRPAAVHAVQFPIETTIDRFWTIEASDNLFEDATLTLRFTAADLPVGFGDPVHASPPIVAAYTTDGGVTWGSASGIVTEVAPVPSGIYEMTIAGLNHFSLWLLHSGTTLPVELTSFTAAASNRNVVVSWRVESESNNGAYRIYRSTDRTVVGELEVVVPGRGTTGEPHVYSWIDSRVTNEVTYYYRLADVNLDGHEHMYPSIVCATPSPQAIGIVPFKYSLMPNFPNPFNATTQIRFAIRDAGPVLLALYDVHGREVARLVNQPMAANTYQIEYNAFRLPSGVYFLRLETPKFSSTRKVMLVK